MREIIFRGKRLDNGEWVASGNLLHADDNGKHSYYIPVYGDRFGTVEDEHDNILSIEYGTFYKVDPATVGQYTGLPDKNDVKIFEGDIIRCHTGRIVEVRFGQHYDEENESFAYGWFVVDDDGALSLGEEWAGHEVIGNIYDNPELLEVPHGV